jgi:hypothetical protein
MPVRDMLKPNFRCVPNESFHLVMAKKQSQNFQNKMHRNTKNKQNFEKRNKQRTTNFRRKKIFYYRLKQGQILFQLAYMKDYYSLGTHM